MQEPHPGCLALVTDALLYRQVDRQKRNLRILNKPSKTKHPP